MRLSIEEVRHIALLARVAMTEAELERMRDEMSNILDHFDVLQQVDTEGVEPTAHTADVRSVMRDDEVRPSATKEDVLSNAPRREDDFLRVRAVLE
jgi:aspartyl-tRNA(Asn)/glutamyl-tRNA(Gln) amidotransferase subunit C